MEESKKNSQQLFEHAQSLAEKHAELKSIVISMLNEMDALELEYIKTIKEIKNK